MPGFNLMLDLMYTLT